MLNCIFFGIAAFRVFLFYLKKNILRQMCPVNDLKSQTTESKRNLAVSPRPGHMFLYISSKLPEKEKKRKKEHFTVQAICL